MGLDFDKSMEKDNAEPLPYYRNCPMCEFKCNDSGMILEHLCVSHFKEPLVSNYGYLMKGNSCDLCNADFIDDVPLLIHIGITHKKLDELMDKVLRPNKTDNQEKGGINVKE